MRGNRHALPILYRTYKNKGGTLNNIESFSNQPNGITQKWLSQIHNQLKISYYNQDKIGYYNQDEIGYYN